MTANEVSYYTLFAVLNLTLLVTPLKTIQI